MASDFLWITFVVLSNFYHYTTSKSIDNCHQAKYICVRNEHYDFAPNCSKIGTPLQLINKRNCLMSACLNNSNVVIYNTKRFSCSMYSCESNSDGTDWAYDWKNGMDNVGKPFIFAFVLPHPSQQMCHNSYFIQKIFKTLNIHNICPNITTYKAVNDVERCMSTACDENADVLDFSDGTCKIMNCKKWFYHDLSPMKMLNKSVVFTKSSRLDEVFLHNIQRTKSTRKFTTKNFEMTMNDKSLLKTITDVSSFDTMPRDQNDVSQDMKPRATKSTIKSFDVAITDKSISDIETRKSITDVRSTFSTEEMKPDQSQNLDIKVLPLIIIGPSSGLIALIVGCVIRQRFKRLAASKVTSEISSDFPSSEFSIHSSDIPSGRNSGASSYVYASLDESKMLPQQFFQNMTNHLWESDSFQAGESNHLEISGASARIDPTTNDMGETVPLRGMHPEESEQ
ncbi:unnamed protein product [Owenia fusiformis]|uniref:Uncharacterized protein n=1 Tax=Owenia fusiformis TaxID=6347 RepID=A0A8J1Y574_OWEFU|nr:unnamed protein product [Owenia fusiformis]